MMGTSTVFGQMQMTNTALQQAKIDVVYLASDYLEGRETGTAGEKLAAEYIVHRFSGIGLSPKGDNGGWYQSFDFDFKTNPHAASGEARTGNNVVAFLDNGAANTIVIGAHYDHLGQGNFSSLHAGERAIHNGADDNASGIAAMLRLATELKEGKASGNNYLFIAFSGEELGLFGSKYFVNNPTINLGTVNYMINMDMVGRLNEEKVLAVYGVGTSPAFRSVLENIRIGGIKITTSDSGVGPSDHTSFYLKDLPVLHFFTGQHREYHKPADDSGLINYNGLMEVTDYIMALLEQLDDDAKLAFSKTKDESEDDQKVSKFKVTLGVMPDYVHSGTGMRIDAVLDDKPAQKAGIQDGDVVIRIGDMEVKDIYGYMEGLSHYKSGDKAKVKVKRGDKELEFDVVF
ncbi:peptidase M28 [Flavilitoribacter nigricans DSM 23189 = NBRC 102662]|uniref:Peptidase M28 n=2 Tax=Flavilitoribacter TaxID=2762562 RepID=A0A2D0N7Z0_FLAN2|nr:peptidase M28 [Flavilitoribacter nigricans DSM 23189 = NBRC 102662]